MSLQKNTTQVHVKTEHNDDREPNGVGEVANRERDTM